VSTAAAPAPPCFADIERAARRLSGQAVSTPLLAPPALVPVVGTNVLVKAESLQRTGSFKFRGAYNKLCTLSPGERARGVIAYSSGNHAQGVAEAARLLGVDATIVMPEDAPPLKLARTRASGATVVVYDRYRQDRRALAEDIAARSGRVMIPPFDDPEIIAGQGTVGLEIARQCAGLGVAPAAVLVPCGGGGLTAGVGIALRTLQPASEIYAVEPEAFDDTRRSLAAGRRLANPSDARSICDALLGEPSELTFTINRRLVSGVLTVSDDAVRDAMELAFRELKLVAEPSGIVGLAALLEGGLKDAGGPVVLVLSGGNVDPGFYRRVLA